MLLPNEEVEVAWGKLDAVAVRDGIGRTSFNAVTAENASGVVDIIDLGVAFAGRDPVLVGVFGSLDVDAICRARRRTQEASHTFFQAILVALKDVEAAVACFDRWGCVRKPFRRGLPEHGPKSDAKSFI